MRESAFVDIDTQFDFMCPRGKLYVPGAGDLIPNLKRLTEFASRNSIFIISTVDVHSSGDPEFRQFPTHCLAGSRGQKKIPETLLRRHSVVRLGGTLSKEELFARIKGYGQSVVEKDVYDPIMDLNLLRMSKPFRNVFIYGVALDYCVKSAVVGFIQAGLEVNLITDATKAIDVKQGALLTGLLKDNGVKLVKTRNVISKFGS